LSDSVFSKYPRYNLPVLWIAGRKGCNKE